MNKLSIKKIVMVILGTVALSLGFMGILLPVLPTTPFLLLASYCYLRSSKRLYTWLITHKVFGIYIYNYMTYKAVTRKTKVFALIFLWMSLLISIYLISSFYLTIVLVIVGLLVSLHLITLKTINAEELNKKKIEDSINPT